jgi:hypothetical protein
MDHHQLIEQLKSELELAKSSLKDVQSKHHRVDHELKSMVSAQKNLYSFQERIEQQKVIYSQIAQVGNRFNETLDFQVVLDGLNRFIIDLLNFEHFILLLQDQRSAKWTIKSFGGYHTPIAKSGLIHWTGIPSSTNLHENPIVKVGWKAIIKNSDITTAFPGLSAHRKSRKTTQGNPYRGELSSERSPSRNHLRDT